MTSCLDLHSCSWCRRQYLPHKQDKHPPLWSNSLRPSCRISKPIHGIERFGPSKYQTRMWVYSGSKSSRKTFNLSILCLLGKQTPQNFGLVCNQAGNHQSHSAGTPNMTSAVISQNAQNTNMGTPTTLGCIGAIEHVRLAWVVFSVARDTWTRFKCWFQTMHANFQCKVGCSLRQNCNKDQFRSDLPPEATRGDTKLLCSRLDRKCHGCLSSGQHSGHQKVQMLFCPGTGMAKQYFPHYLHNLSIPRSTLENVSRLSFWRKKTYPDVARQNIPAEDVNRHWNALHQPWVYLWHTKAQCRHQFFVDKQAQYAQEILRPPKQNKYCAITISTLCLIGHMPSWQ